MTKTTKADGKAVGLEDQEEPRATVIDQTESETSKEVQEQHDREGIQEEHSYLSSC